MLEMSSCQWELNVALSITAEAEIGVGTGRPDAGSQRSYLLYLTSSGDLSSLSSHLALEYILLTTVILCNARSSVWRNYEKRLFHHWCCPHAYNLSKAVRKTSA